jgi:hypothetical protein
LNTSRSCRKWDREIPGFLPGSDRAKGRERRRDFLEIPAAPANSSVLPEKVQQYPLFGRVAGVIQDGLEPRFGVRIRSTKRAKVSGDLTAEAISAPSATGAGETGCAQEKTANASQAIGRRFLPLFT